MERRLAAIMAADVVGYARLIRADEEGTLAALKALRAELIDPNLRAHNGRIVKLMGDGMLAEFASVVDAVRAAVATQRAVAERNSALPDDKRIELRVGINLGDVVIDGSDIHGDGVNVAARLEALAAPGAVCISDAVYEQVRDRVGLEFRDLGERQVKNLDRPIRAWQLVGSIAARSGDEHSTQSAASRSPTKAAESIFERPAVLVAPFETIGGDADDQYFTRGVSEDIGSTLSYWRWMPVIGPAAVPATENARDLPSLARSLGAGYAVGGSLRRLGSKVRLTALLVDADTSRTIWSRRFDGTADDIFDFQEQLSENVVALIEPEIERAEQLRLRKVRPGSFTAWDYLLKAAEAQRRGGSGYGTRESNEEAMRLIDAAIEVDPDLADAWAARAQRYWYTVIANWTDDREAAIARSLEFSQRAIELDPSNAFARSAYAIVKLFGHGDVIAAQDNALEAIRLNPSSPHARHIGGCVLEFLGEAESALVHLDTIFRLNPNHFAAAVAQADQMTCHMILGQFERAVEIGRRMKSRDPNYIRGLQRYVAALAHAGLVDEARAELANLLTQQPDLSEAYLRATYPFQKPEHLELIIDGLRLADFEDRAQGPRS